MRVAYFSGALSRRKTAKLTRKTQILQESLLERVGVVKAVKKGPRWSCGDFRDEVILEFPRLCWLRASALEQNLA